MVEEEEVVVGELLLQEQMVELAYLELVQEVVELCKKVLILVDQVVL